MPTEFNAYAAPQTIDLQVPAKLPIARPAARLLLDYLWQGIARGFAAGLFASLAMLLLFLVRMLSGYRAEALNLFLIAGAFIAVTLVLGLVWGIAYACFAKLSPGELPELDHTDGTSPAATLTR